MNKIDVICHRYLLTKKDDYIKFNDIITNVLKKDRIKLLVKSLNDENKIVTIDNIQYISIDDFKKVITQYSLLTCKN